MLFSNHLVRDLAWACFSSPLMITGDIADDAHNVANCGLELTPARRIRLAELDENPAPLEAFLEHRLPSRLGLYFEKLWQFFLTDDPAVDLLAHNLPVRENGHTLGEFDCLYYCHERRRTFHLELAVKYYLGWRGHSDPTDGASWAAWVGPNAADRLDLKLARLLDHQTRLAQSPAGAATLRGAGIDAPAAEAEIKGWLFNPLARPLSAPHGYNAERQMGTWLRYSQMAAFLEGNSASCWRILPRLEWLAPSVGETPPLDAAQLLRALGQHFVQRYQPVQLAQFDCGDPAGTEAFTRVFVVGEDWPGDRRPGSH